MKLMIPNVFHKFSSGHYSDIRNR